MTLPDGRGRRRDIYLGKYGSAASRREYLRVIGEWETLGRLPADLDSAPADLTVNELLARFWERAKLRYVKNGQPTSEQDAVRMAMRPMKQLYGCTLARTFGPLALKASARQ